MKVLTTGHDGNIGKELMSRGIKPLIMDITNAKDTKKAIEKSNPDILIHCAALTDVDECERNPRKAFEINVLGVKNILDWFNGTFIYISTDHVFEGKKNWFWQYSERHTPNPINEYGRTKLAGEGMTQTAVGKYHIIRTSRLFNYKMMKDDLDIAYSGTPNEFTNLIKRSFLHVNHFVDNLLWFVDNIDRMPHILHIAGNDTMSYYYFWVQAAKCLDFDEKVIVKRDYELKDKTPRPFKGGLDTKLSQRLGMPQYSAVDGLYIVKEEK